MPALVERMAYCKDRGMPWHRTGNAFASGEVTSWEQMRTLAGLDWEVRTGSLQYPDKNGKPVTLEGWKRVYRDDTNAVLHVAKPGYTLHTHEELGKLIEALHEVGSNRGIDWDTAGSLDSGKKVFAAAKLGDDWEVPGDPSPTRSFLTILTSHDGTGATKGGLCNTRVVCANTFRAAETEMKKENGRAFWFRHSRSLDSYIEDAKNAIKYGIKQMETARTRAEALARVPFTDEQIYEWIDRLYPLPEHKATDTKKEHDAKARSVERNRQELGYICMENNPNLEGIRNTVWGVFSAAIEYTDHYRKRQSQDRYVESTLFSENKGKRFSLLTALDIAQSGDGKKVKVSV